MTTGATAAIGVDLGGTKCAAGLVHLGDGRVLARRLEPTRPARGGQAVLDDVVAMIQSLAGEAAREGATVDAAGVGVAELVSGDGRVLSDATIAWRRLPVVDEIARRTGLEIWLDADVRAAARAEARWGAGEPFAAFLYVTIGTGISACLVLDGAPYLGARGLTGTMASAPGLIPAEGGTLATGPPLEQFAAGPALAARFAAERAGFSGTAREVLALAEGGDANAAAIVASAGTAIGAAVGQLVNMLDPEAVVLGGGLGLVGGSFRQAIDESLRRHIWSPLHRELPLVSARLGNDAGFIGAALAASPRTRP